MERSNLKSILQKHLAGFYYFVNHYSQSSVLGFFLTHCEWLTVTIDAGFTPFCPAAAFSFFAIDVVDALCIKNNRSSLRIPKKLDGGRSSKLLFTEMAVTMKPSSLGHLLWNLFSTTKTTVMCHNNLQKSKTWNFLTYRAVDDTFWFLKYRIASTYFG